MKFSSKPRDTKREKIEAKSRKQIETIELVT